VLIAEPRPSAATFLIPRRSIGAPRPARRPAARSRSPRRCRVATAHVTPRAAHASTRSPRTTPAAGASSARPCAYAPPSASPSPSAPASHRTAARAADRARSEPRLDLLGATEHREHALVGSSRARSAEPPTRAVPTRRGNRCWNDYPEPEPARCHLGGSCRRSMSFSTLRVPNQRVVQHSGCRARSRRSGQLGVTPRRGEVGVPEHRLQRAQLAAARRYGAVSAPPVELKASTPPRFVCRGLVTASKERERRRV
jgi:hypothetical protein